MTYEWHKKKYCVLFQVSPAKLALRRHLSQEKLAATQQGIGSAIISGGIVGTRTIGDLVSGEIERTLEISNQVNTFLIFLTLKSGHFESGQIFEI